jgi:hypothetical membrane protein
MEQTALEVLLTNVGLVSTSLFNIVTSTVASITATGHELLLVFMLISVVGAGVGLFQRIRG